MSRSWGAPSVLFLCLGFASASSPPDDPLHARIDKAVESAHVGAPAPPADDATFLRRITLDLTGTIPTVAEARAFLADSATDKRAKAIDRLLSSRGYVRHMATTFDILLMERRRDKYVKQDPWRTYLIDSFAANKPYDRLVRELLGADGVDSKMHPAAKFHLEREVEPNALTRDVGRMFFGMDLQCAQCHDHPRIEDYLQRDYYGLYAFLNRSYLFQPDKKKPAVLAEKAEGSVAFKSVFTNAEGTTRPRLPGGREIDEPSFKKGDGWKVAPDKKKKTLRPVPKYSRLAQLAKHATDGRNRAFNRNIVNRLWAHMMGRGLVQPVDLHHSGNPPANPVVLDLLADAFVEMKYDIRAFLRELALTRTYQRSFEMPVALAKEAAEAAARLAELRKEHDRLEKAVEAARAGVDKASEALAAARKKITALEGERSKAVAAVAAAKKTVASALKDRDAKRKALAPRLDLLKSVAEAAEKAGAAASRLPEDKELAAAAETFASHRVKLDGAIRKELAGNDSAHQASLEKQTAAEGAVQGLGSNILKAEEDFKALEARREAAIARKKAERVAARHAARRVAAAEALVEYGKLTEAEADPEKRNKALQDLTSRWADDFAVGAFGALTPEQLCWSMLEATGQAALQRNAGGAAYDKKNKSKDARARAAYAEQYAYDKLKGNVSAFVSLYGAAAGQPQDAFFATADQALFLANGGNLRGWLSPARGSLSDRLNRQADPKALAEELYLGVLTRLPTPEETAEVRRYLESKPKKKLEAVQELAWALLSSVEFRFRH